MKDLLKNLKKKEDLPKLKRRDAQLQKHED